MSKKAGCLIICLVSSLLCSLNCTHWPSWIDKSKASKFNISTYDNWFAIIKADRKTFFYLNHDELGILQSYLQGDLDLADAVF